MKNFSYSKLSTLLALALALGSVSCAGTLETAFEKRPYFGQTADGSLANDFVPREVRRVEPWLPLF